ncbi:hypothetical protein [Enterobacter mori]|uniref:hypothetical protein n=1 Tax=Enterobacter mori TaxID=539813 RepID=UPI001B8D6C67|nr:hypothetical protein [Enterobacter mori]MBS3050426.1 hypothetical protein [Enterobacter mori]
MRINYTICEMLFRLSLLPLFVLLASCTQSNGVRGHDNGHIIEGVIVNQRTAIPENSLVTLSVSADKQKGEKAYTFHEYTLITSTEKHTIPFTLRLSNELSLFPLPLTITVRIEKDRELIMMSDIITTLPHQSGEKITLSVIDS